VPAGTNGGITFLGTVASTMGGALIGLVSGLMIPQAMCFSPMLTLKLVLIGTLSGLVGSLIDSLLGATLQKSVFNTKSKQIIVEGRKLKDNESDTDFKVISGWEVLDNHQVCSSQVVDEITYF
jgi:uncharacterized membrane protein